MQNEFKKCKNENIYNKIIEIIKKYNFNIDLNLNSKENLSHDFSMNEIKYYLKHENLLSYYDICNDNEKQKILHMIEFCENYYSISNNELSLGEHQIIDTILIFESTLKGKYIILYDEPCPNISIWQSQNMSDYMNNYNNINNIHGQILMITHNYSLFNFDNNLHYINKFNKININTDDLLIKRLNNYDLGKKLLLATNAILVEGITDKIFYEHILPKKNILFIDCNGKYLLFSALIFAIKYDLNILVGIIDEIKDNINYKDINNILSLTKITPEIIKYFTGINNENIIKNICITIEEFKNLLKKIIILQLFKCCQIEYEQNTFSVKYILYDHKYIVNPIKKIELEDFYILWNIKINKNNDKNNDKNNKLYLLNDNLEKIKNENINEYHTNYNYYNNLRNMLIKIIDNPTSYEDNLLHKNNNKKIINNSSHKDIINNPTSHEDNSSYEDIIDNVYHI
jgi:ABC-type lipoprotein export system ATPase subunit